MIFFVLGGNKPRGLRVTTAWAIDFGLEWTESSIRGERTPTGLEIRDIADLDVCASGYWCASGRRGCLRCFPIQTQLAEVFAHCDQVPDFEPLRIYRDCELVTIVADGQWDHSGG